MDKKYYYEVHIFYGRNDGHSVFFESDKHLTDEEDIIEEADRKGIEELGDCSYAQEITKEEYCMWTGR